MKESREEKMGIIQQKLEQGVKDIYESDKYKAYIETMSKFPHYSINNCILIASQCPMATRVCGFKTWQKDFNRSVNQGEKGIMIIAPRKVKAEVEETVYDRNGKAVRKEDGSVVTEKVEREFQTFRPAYVFDVSQTSGEPLPSLVSRLEESVDGYDELKEILVSISPVPVCFEVIEGEVNGYFNPVEKRIVVDESLPQLQTVKTLIHEIAHATLGHGGDGDKWDREAKEIQAESVAYWVSQMIGLDTSEYSFGYITGWSKDREVSELKDNLEVIKGAADKISSSIEEILCKAQSIENTDDLEPDEKIIKKSSRKI